MTKPTPMPSPQPRPAGPSRLQRLASALVLHYVRRCPVERGKWRLLRLANRFLVVPLGRGAFVRVPGLSIVEREIVRHGVFEQETAGLFCDLLAPGMVVMDVGANVGQYTLLAAPRVGPAGRVHAFEPTPRVAAKLRASVRLNGFANVAVNEAAVSEAPGQVTLYYVEDDDGENSILGGKAGCPSVTVPAVTLDDYVAAHGLGRVDVVKMDIEGAELLALRGARRLLSGDDAPVVILEVNPKSLAFSGSSVADLLGLLQGYGYRVHEVASYGTPGHHRWANAVALKPAHRERFPALRGLALRPVAAA